MTHFRFHALGVPHTITSKEYNACAFTQKVLNFCKMMTQNGHIVYHYGHEDSKLDCTEHVTVVTREEYKDCYGSYDFKKTQYKFSQSDSVYTLFYDRTVQEINKRKKDNDFLLCFWGTGHQKVAENVQNIIVVEPGIGYPTAFSRWRIYESHAIRNAFQGSEYVSSCKEDWYHAVIPNYFDLHDFDYSFEKSDYFLFIGRLNGGKGIHIAIQVCQTLGIPLKIVGQGKDLMDLGIDLSKPENSMITFVGHVDVHQRKEIMKRAKATIVASMYCEPFGGVQVESLLCGTPIITNDWGVFPEINVHGVTGYRCRTFEQFLWAFKNIDKISPFHCRQYAAANYSLEKVYTMYYEYFKMLYNVHHNKGWYELDENRQTLNWLYKYIPPNYKALILSEKKWSFGRIYQHLCTFLNQKGIYTKFMDWSSDHSLTIEDYDIIIGSSYITNDIIFQKFFRGQDKQKYLQKCWITIHFPIFDHDHFCETIDPQFEGTITGISKETQMNLETVYKKPIPYTPYGVQTSLFKLLPYPKSIKTLGIVGSLSFNEIYQENKGYELFQEIGRQSYCEVVYLYYPDKDWEQIYEPCDLYICCSKFEGGPLPVFEAIASGKPVISTKVGNVQYLKEMNFFETVQEAVSFINYLNEDSVNIEKYVNLLFDEVKQYWDGDILFEHYWYPHILKHIQKSHLSY